ncbi:MULTISPECIES: hypothetical protein [unclassified Lysinibacillus]|uniref:hypothetical protein n=1 Tax=unclassified Lysinibacillus TaxID=2636778 RepID=UPI00104AEDE3|nr:MULTISPECIES: hypothetical protein [unclassified Lysinibacillus]MDD1501487.1 hypothetical protein [Lysinibacillus sp. CNPSo 3705]UPW83147.1 hypothetical protein MY533_21040 [Lysinibacillus sp. Ag94]
MSFSREIQERINRFTKEQSQNYLQDAEMTYIEKLRKKSGQTKRKIDKQLSKFKGRSDQGREAQDDMIIYMSDYMNDLMSQGLTEQEAFNKASEELQFASNSEQSEDLNERFQQYYENRDPADYEAIGLFYGGFLFLGLGIGGLTGFLTGGGYEAFFDKGWIDTAIGAGVGIIIGIGLGQITNAIIALKKK